MKIVNFHFNGGANIGVMDSVLEQINLDGIAMLQMHSTIFAQWALQMTSPLLPYLINLPTINL